MLFEVSSPFHILKTNWYFTACGARSKDRCAFHGIGLDYLFFECPSIGDYFEYLWQEQVWLWTFWYLSQIWITFHIWFPKSPRLASTEQLFGTPMYCSLMIDQSLVLNRFVSFWFHTSFWIPIYCSSTILAANLPNLENEVQLQPRF